MLFAPGTPLGDPIESSALRKAVAQPTSGGQPLAVFTLGAIKALTGHLEGTAGLAGLAQAAAAQQQRQAYALRYRTLNPYVGNSWEGWESSSR